MLISVSSTVHTAWRLPLSRTELEKAMEVIGRELNSSLPGNTLLELALIGDAEMAHLNESYLHCPGPTNILAFPSGEFFLQKASRPTSLGWLALSPVTVCREAMLYGQSLPAYTLRLLAHGFAHLLGYEHGGLMHGACDKAARAAGLYLEQVIE
jgi:probable rRNA maturation factor